MDLTESPAALKRWMIAGPEICHMIGEFETNDPTSPNLKRHEQLFSTQIKFKKEVMTLVCAFEDIGNPFQEDNGDLLTLDTREIMNNDVVETTKSVVKMGQQQYDIFVRERFVEKLMPINDP